MSQRNKRLQVFAVVRVDRRWLLESEDALEVQQFVAVKEILPTLEDAEAEVARLNDPESDDHVYFACATRYFPDGRNVAGND